MIKKIIGCLIIFFMAGVGMANNFTNDNLEKISALAALPGKTYCFLSEEAYGSESLNLIKKDGFQVLKRTELDCGSDCIRYLVSHPNSVFLMGSVHL